MCETWQKSTKNDHEFFALVFPGLNQLILTVEFGIDSITIGFLPGGNVAFIKLGGLDTKLGW